MNAYGTVYVLKFLSLAAAYYWLYRKGLVARAYDRAAARVSRRLRRKSAAPTFAGAAGAAAVMVLPLVLISLVTRVATHAAYCHYKNLDPGWLNWLAREWPSNLWLTFMLVVIGAQHAALSELPFRIDGLLGPTKAKVRRRLIRSHARVRAAGALAGSALRLRRRAAAYAPYRLWFHVVMTCTVVLLMHTVMSEDPFKGQGWTEPMPESPRREAMFEMARRAGVDEIYLGIRHLVDYTGHMNAWGTHYMWGARIEFSDSYLDAQNDAAVKQTTGHELYHVLHANPYTGRAIVCLVAAVLSCFMLGFPREGTAVRRRFLARAPAYAVLLVLMWPAVQATRNALKRPNEARADAFGARLAVGGRLISLEQAKAALIRGNQYNSTDPDPAWLFKVLFYDHPPLVERLRNLDEVVNQMSAETAQKGRPGRDL